MQNNNLSELIKIIEDKASISEIVSDYITLEKKGNNHVGLCPFHSDSNPSMSVSDSKNIFKCFVCGAGGSAISFVQNYEGISFIEAIKRISEKLKIDWTKYITDRKVNINPEEKRGWEINEEALNFFKYNLKNNTNKDIENYINSRGISDEIVDKFDIGYSGEGLSNFLLNKNFTEDEIVKYGLAKRREDTTLQDYFIERLMFTIRNKEGKVVGFSGRTITDSKYVKYMNSPENPVFKKSKILYNLNNARITGNLKKEVIVVEGFMDVIALYKSGIENSIATMGTAFTNDHIKETSSITNNVVLAFDSDLAGINATISTGKTLLSNNVNVDVVSIPSGKDFDELLKLGKDKVEETLKEKMNFIYFYRDMVFKKLDSQGDNISFEVLNELFKLLSNIKDSILVNRMISDIADRYNIDKEVLLEEYNKTNSIKQSSKNNTSNKDYIPEPPFIPEFVNRPTTEEVKLQKFTNSIKKDDVRHNSKMRLFMMEEEIISYALAYDYALKYLIENPIVILNEELRKLWETFTNSLNSNSIIEDEVIFTRISHLKMNLVENNNKSEINEVYDEETYSHLIDKYNHQLENFNRENLKQAIIDESDFEEKEHLLKMLSKLT